MNQRTVMSHDELRIYWGRISENTKAAYEDASIELRKIMARATDEILESLEEDNDG
jgi:hypothetical protein